MVHLLPKHPSALRVSQLCVDLGLCSNVTTLICWLKSNPKVQCEVPLGCALGPSHLSPVSLKGPHQGRSILRAAGCPCCVCMGLWKAESHSLKQIQSLALGIELDATSSQDRQTTEWPRGFELNWLIFPDEPTLDSIAVTLYGGSALSPYPVFLSPVFLQRQTRAGHRRTQTRLRVGTLCWHRAQVMQWNQALPRLLGFLWRASRLSSYNPLQRTSLLWDFCWNLLTRAFVCFAAVRAIWKHQGGKKGRQTGYLVGHQHSAAAPESIHWQQLISQCMGLGR